MLCQTSYPSHHHTSERRLVCGCLTSFATKLPTEVLRDKHFSAVGSQREKKMDKAVDDGSQREFEHKGVDM